MNHISNLIKKLSTIEGLTLPQLGAIFEFACVAVEAIAADEVTRRLELADLRLRADARRSVPSNALPTPAAAKPRKPRAQKPAPATGDNAA